MLALKQELRGCMRELPYFVKAKVKTKGEISTWVSEMLYRCTQLLNQQNSSWDEEEIYALGT